eukprot:m.392766 g.392766  ORF g.392766 m.392766 type:complete len:799 (-) comp21085_c0_seq1:478-2874(-)
MGEEAMAQMPMNMGLMNAFRTGNMILDVIICMLIPMIVRTIFNSDWPDKINAWIKEYITGEKNYFLRSIVYETKSGGGYYYGQNNDLDSKDRNNLLQKAIRLYLSEKCEFTTENGEVFLIPSKKIKLEADRWGDECRFSGSYQQLMSYRVTLLPAKTEWIEIVNDGIWFRSLTNDSEEGSGDNRSQVRTVTFEVKAYGKEGEAHVDGWIDKVFSWYREKKAAEQDNSRYFLQAQQKKEGDTEFSYKKYQLSDHKTFDTLYFPEKDSLLQLADDFLQKRGKFSIKGFPHKLGLLLDGPPGTGKTSLIKAIAQYTKRHIVSVSLDRIGTNQELMDMMFDNRFNVMNEDEPMVSKMDEIVFVMEDVDAASSVVYARDGANPSVAMPHSNVVASKEEDTAKDVPDKTPSGNPIERQSSTATEDVFDDTADDAAEDSRGVLKRTQSAPHPAYKRTLGRSKSIGSSSELDEKKVTFADDTADGADTDDAPAAPAGPKKLSKAKIDMLREMASWEPEHKRKKTLKFDKQLQRFFQEAEVTYGACKNKVYTWCTSQGAVSFNECIKNMKELAETLDLKPLQQTRLIQLSYRLLGKDEEGNDIEADDDEEDDKGSKGDRLNMQSAMWQRMFMSDSYSDMGSMMGGTDPFVDFGDDMASGAGSDDKGTGSGGSSGGMMSSFGPKNKPYSWEKAKDKLNLAGLLNVLDGVVDSPGRILVMTTNHPEKLDPALIRPGRINKRLHLGYCSVDTVCDMAKHYLQYDKPMNDGQRAECAEICERCTVTPAWVEQCCAEVETYEDLLARLQRTS